MLAMSTNYQNNRNDQNYQNYQNYERKLNLLLSGLKNYWILVFLSDGWKAAKWFISELLIDSARYGAEIKMRGSIFVCSKARIGILEQKGT